LTRQREMKYTFITETVVTVPGVDVPLERR
jgi:hypothetical protein